MPFAVVVSCFRLKAPAVVGSESETSVPVRECQQPRRECDPRLRGPRDNKDGIVASNGTEHLGKLLLVDRLGECRR